MDKKHKETGCVNKKETPGSTKKERTPQMTETVREVILKSPRRSVRKYSSNLKISTRSLCSRILEDLGQHP